VYQSPSGARGSLKGLPQTLEPAAQSLERVPTLRVDTESCIINPLQETIRGCKLTLVPLLPHGTCKRRHSTIRNILEMPQISLLFMIPDISITWRVNGQAQINFDPDILSRFVARERLPKRVMVVSV